MNQPQQGGFTLVEIAIAVAIVGLLLGGTVMTLAAQMELRNTAETRATMDRARDAILGFAAANGRLPCPATASGVENPSPAVIPNNCATNFEGFVPAATLALTPTDPAGRLIDAWGQPIRYSVPEPSSHVFTTASGMRNAGMAALNAELGNFGLKVCDANIATCTGATSGANVLTEVAVVVLISSGNNQSFEDSVENFDGDRFYFYRPPGPAADDLMLWISPYTLYNRLLEAGAL